MSETPESQAFPWERIKPYRFYGVAAALVRVIAPILFSVKVKGRENLPKSSHGLILASNHLHSIDPAFFVAYSHRKWRFMAKTELFRNKFVAFILRNANGFPVNRDAIDRKALRFAVEVMQDGRCGLGIFPEGQRSPDGLPREAKAGIAMLARETKADILPCSLYHEGKLGFRTRVTVRFGKVIPFGELGLGDTPNKRETRAACEKIMGAITELWEKKDA
ncbi:MAG: 1-acyl-sn-glycerol-3-phosphate acyltransferase [Oscillospiraceae bacterium]|jgi:1-acyl-sn-glycerol-3-phosphate acyltransferase|nr:1-acyl-sn-glycerol-3-phosphate acyltransferase [Oscillospiraceae bacterium]